jgi:hypothetical protein
VNIDHRRAAAFAPGEAIAYIRAGWDLDQDIKTYIEVVHRLNNLGAVVTHAAHGTSHEGFDAEWRGVQILTVEGDMVSRSEIFDERDIDAALAKFDELGRPTPRLENTASQVVERFLAHFTARDWDAMAENLVVDYSSDDRRRVVNAGIRQGRDGEIENYRAAANLGFTHVTTAVIATRGERLVLSRVRSSARDQQLEPFGMEVLGVTAINADDRIAAVVVFDPDDIDAAFDELDARYVAGKAAAHLHTWSIVAGAYATLNRRELPSTTPDWVNIDHRRVTTIAPGDLIAFIRAAWDLERDICNRIETVHRLNDLGAAVTRVSNETSQQGFDAEWRSIDVLTIEGDLVNRLEIFDEADIDAALARFDELTRPAPVLKNTATRTWARLVDAFNRRDVDGFLALSTADGRFEDRRKGLRAVLEGPERRKAVHAVFEEAPSSWRMEVEPIAIRGSRLSLTRECYRDTEDADRPIAVELLNVTEVSAGDLMQDIVSFDPDNIDAAFEELDSRYLAGEAAPHAHTWSVIAGVYAALARRELPPTTPDWVNIDHRRTTAFAPGDAIASLQATWDLTSDFAIHIETVHRLTDLGAAFTYAAHGTSQGGFDAEWHEIAIVAVEGDIINHCELFDEQDIDAAVARFEELNRLA